jgi:hypothetical protein
MDNVYMKPDDHGQQQTQPQQQQQQQQNIQLNVHHPNIAQQQAESLSHRRQGTKRYADKMEFDLLKAEAGSPDTTWQQAAKNSKQELLDRSEGVARLIGRRGTRKAGIVSAALLGAKAFGTGYMAGKERKRNQIQKVALQKALLNKARELDTRQDEILTSNAAATRSEKAEAAALKHQRDLEKMKIKMSGARDIASMRAKASREKDIARKAEKIQRDSKRQQEKREKEIAAKVKSVRGASNEESEFLKNVLRNKPEDFDRYVQPEMKVSRSMVPFMSKRTPTGRREFNKDAYNKLKQDLDGFNANEMERK